MKLSNNKFTWTKDEKERYGIGTSVKQLIDIGQQSNRETRGSFWKQFGINAPFKPMTIYMTGVSNASKPPFAADNSEVQYNFLINPINFKISYGHIVNTTYTRSGWIREFFGDNLTKISCDLNTAAFKDPINMGLTSEYLSTSPGYRNLLNFIDIYRSNGRNFVEYNKDTLIEGSLYKGGVFTYGGTNIIKDVGQVFINYDYVTYYGVFESMSVSHDAERPFYMSFSFNYTVTHLIEHWRASNSNMMDINLASMTSSIASVWDKLDFSGKNIGAIG